MKYVFVILVFLLSVNIAYAESEDQRMKLYKFNETKTTSCITCIHVLEHDKPVLYVTHDSDGDWQFLCGMDNHAEDDAKVNYVAMTSLAPKV